MIIQLPNIDQIKVEDILLLKNELESELFKFKGVILYYSKELESEPFSKNAKSEMKKQFDYHIKPELKDLRNQISRNKFYKNLTNELISNASSYAT